MKKEEIEKIARELDLDVKNALKKPVDTLFLRMERGKRITI
jgi:hypothetical protein